MKRRRLLFAGGALLLTRPFKALASWFRPATQEQNTSEVFYQLKELEAQLSASDSRYLPFLNVNALRTGLYTLPAKSEDKQQPHDHDEVYYVISGKSKFISGKKTTNVTSGTVLYVKAKEIHRFFEIEEDLKMIVFFSNMKTD